VLLLLVATVTCAFTNWQSFGENSQTLLPRLPKLYLSWFLRHPDYLYDCLIVKMPEHSRQVLMMLLALLPATTGQPLTKLKTEHFKFCCRDFLFNYLDSEKFPILRRIPTVTKNVQHIKKFPTLGVYPFSVHGRSRSRTIKF